jgi:hypothetical protein
MEKEKPENGILSSRHTHTQRPTDELASHLGSSIWRGSSPKKSRAFHHTCSEPTCPHLGRRANSKVKRQGGIQQREESLPAGSDNGAVAGVGEGVEVGNNSFAFHFNAVEALPSDAWSEARAGHGWFRDRPCPPPCFRAVALSILDEQAMTAVVRGCCRPARLRCQLVAASGPRIPSASTRREALSATWPSIFPLCSSRYLCLCSH